MSEAEAFDVVSIAFLCGMLVGGVLGWIGMWLAKEDQP